MARRKQDDLVREVLKIDDINRLLLCIDTILMNSQADYVKALKLLHKKPEIFPTELQKYVLRNLFRLSTEQNGRFQNRNLRLEVEKLIIKESEKILDDQTSSFLPETLAPNSTIVDLRKDPKGKANPFILRLAAFNLLYKRPGWKSQIPEELQRRAHHVLHPYEIEKRSPVPLNHTLTDPARLALSNQLLDLSTSVSLTM